MGGSLIPIRMYRKKALIPFIFLCLFALRSQGQGDNVTLKYFGVTLHPFGDDLASVQPYKLDKNAHLVFNFGGFLGYEHYLWEDILSLKLTQGLFTDCSNGWAGFTHLGLRGVFYDKGRHHAMLGFGPMMFYRESWTRFPNYEDKGIFALSKDRSVQYKFFWYGTEIEYNYRLSKRTDLSVTFTPGLPFVITYAVGLKYWFNKDFRIKG